MAALSAIALTLGACQSSRSVAERMVDKYSLKKRKSHITCMLGPAPSSCLVPVKVSGDAYRQMLSTAESLKGTPYRFGGCTTDGFDCSGFVQYLFASSFSLQLPRTSVELALTGKMVPREDLRRGDLVFFSFGGESVDHVGVFVGNGSFTHASSSGGVATGSLRAPYYEARFAFGTRLITVE